MILLIFLQKASVASPPVFNGREVLKPLEPLKDGTSLGLAKEVDILTPYQSQNVLLSRGQLSQLSLNKKIIIVDDLHLSANTLRERLEKYFTKENGCLIEIETSPELALRKIKAAKDSGHPYDVLVTDLFMQTFEGDKAVGINGDEMLRQLANEKYFLPAVIYSGSWSNGIEVNFSDQLDQIKTELELQLIMGEKTVQPGIPIIHIAKNGITDTDSFFQKSLMYLGQQKDDEKLELISEYVKDFKPDLHETTLNSFFLCRVVEGMGLFIQKTEEAIDAVNHLPTGDLEGWRLTNHERQKQILAKYLGIIKKSKSSFSALSSLSIAEIRKQLHDFAGLASCITGPVEGFADIDPRVKKHYEDLMDIYNLIKAYMRSSKQSEKKVCDLGDLVNRVLFKCKAGNKKLILSSNMNENLNKINIHSVPELVMEFLEHPISNALKAVRAKDDGIVNVSLKQVTLSDLPSECQQKFSNDINSKIAEVLIEDNGCGINPERLGRINSKKAISGDSTFGTLGWGMDYMQENIDLLGGAYYVESEVGKGTKFRLFFKIDESVKAE